MPDTHVPSLVEFLEDDAGDEHVPSPSEVRKARAQRDDVAAKHRVSTRPIDSGVVMDPRLRVLGAKPNKK